MENIYKINTMINEYNLIETYCRVWGTLAMEKNYKDGLVNYY